MRYWVRARVKAGREAAWLLACTVDLPHIDAIHRYGGIKADFRAWQPKVPAGGCVMFHDTESFPEVRQFFDELPGRKANVPAHHGLGFWYKP